MNCSTESDMYGRCWSSWLAAGWSSRHSVDRVSEIYSLISTLIFVGRFLTLTLDTISSSSPYLHPSLMNILWISRWSVNNRRTSDSNQCLISFSSSPSSRQNMLFLVSRNSIQTANLKFVSTLPSIRARLSINWLELFRRPAFRAPTT